MTKKIIGFSPNEPMDVVDDIVYTTDDYINEAYGVLFDLIRANRKIKALSLTIDFTDKKKINITHF